MTDADVKQEARETVQWLEKNCLESFWGTPESSIEIKTTLLLFSKDAR